MITIALLPQPPEHLPEWREGMRLLTELLVSQVENAPAPAAPDDELVREI